MSAPLRRLHHLGLYHITSAGLLISVGCWPKDRPLLHWRVTGSNAAHYEVVQDRHVRYAGGGSHRLHSLPTATDTSGACSVQLLEAAPFRHQRIRLSGYMRTENAPVANPYLRIEGLRDDEWVRLGFDGTNVVNGTSDWSTFDMILDVPDGSEIVVYGGCVAGRGHMWLDALTFETVPRTLSNAVSSPSEVLYRNAAFPEIPSEHMFVEPSNLDFERSGEWPLVPGR